jgi:hypothetical protein
VSVYLSIYILADPLTARATVVSAYLLSRACVVAIMGAVASRLGMRRAASADLEWRVRLHGAVRGDGGLCRVAGARWVNDLDEL